jgi:hypothetical protein
MRKSGIDQTRVFSPYLFVVSAAPRPTGGVPCLFGAAFVCHSWPDSLLLLLLCVKELKSSPNCPHHART